MEQICALCTRDTALILLTCYYTGLRIGDVLSITTEDIIASNDFVLCEAKTGKWRDVCFSRTDVKAYQLYRLLRERACRNRGNQYIFASPRDPVHRSRTREGVYKAMIRACRQLGIQRASAHSLRKLWTVELYRKTRNLQLVQRRLNHDNLSTTLIYAFSDKFL